MARVGVLKKTGLSIIFILFDPDNLLKLNNIYITDDNKLKNLINKYHESGADWNF